MLMKKVAAAVIEKDGKILVAQRKGGALAGKWEFPGGKLEPGETPEQCLARELREEFDIEARIGAFICASRFEYKHISIELLAYRAAHVSGEFRLNDHARIAWVAPAELRGYDLSSADIPVAEAVIKEGAC